MDSAGLETARRALRQRFLALVSVQSCIAPPQVPLLLIHTWTGVVIHVHFVLAPLKTRAIKRILQESTDVGVGSLFLVDRAILPAMDARLTVPEWLLALHALAHDRVYSFEFVEPEIHLGQLHFEPIGTTGDMAALFGPPPKLDRLRFLRTTVRPRYIKGDWQLADFGPEAFWKDQYSTRHGTTHNTYRRPDAREYQWKSWSSTGWEQPRTEDAARPFIPQRDRVEAAYSLLEIERGATKDEARAAYRKLALNYHPDTSTLPKTEAEQKFRELNEAYETLRSANKWP